MKVLIACEFSGIVREAFREKGHDAWSCDLLPTEIPGQHVEADVKDFLYAYNWDLIIAHPPCTYLANSGVRWLYNKDGTKNWDRCRRMDDATNFFAMFQIYYNIRYTRGVKVCIENPIMHKHAKESIGDYTQIIQPWQFGHGETKATCLWLYGLPKLEPTNIVEGREQRIWKMSPGPERQKERSNTYQGIANAMAEQWG